MNDKAIEAASGGTGTAAKVQFAAGRRRPDRSRQLRFRGDAGVIGLADDRARASIGYFQLQRRQARLPFFALDVPSEESMMKDISGKAAIQARELAFIDPGVADVGTLLQGLRTGVDAIMLQADRPALAQMAAHVQGRAGLDAIHVVAHGAPGEVAFRGGTLSHSSLDAWHEDLQALGRALGPDGDLRLWSCETGAGAIGEAFVDALSDAAGIPVSAALHPIGGGHGGGNGALSARLPTPTPTPTPYRLLRAKRRPATPVCWP